MNDLPNSSEPSITRAIASTAYDTAWVASVSSHDAPDVPRYPLAHTWIAERQHPDGSWGSDIPYVPDRVVSTLSSLVALARLGTDGAARRQIQRGERYLWQHAHILRHEPCELVAFELLLPSLIRRAVDAGIDVPPHLDHYAPERRAKLALLPTEQIYSPYLTTTHALEFLGSRVDRERLLQAQAANGSIGNSPAATAFLLQHVEDSAAVSYLDACVEGDGRGGAPVLAPCEVFESLWIAYHRYLAGVPASALLSDQQCSSLAEALSHGGVTLSPSFLIPDADDTAIALLLLDARGNAVAPDALVRFERDDHFVSFPFERHPSTGVNIHVLAALSHYKSYPDRPAAIRKILSFLARTRIQESYWVDKWHLSPLYATSHAIVALSKVAAEVPREVAPLIDRAVSWILHTQNENGSWGHTGIPTAEETAYALIGLCHAPVRDPPVQQAVATGVAYLEALAGAPHPALWLDKCLYYPIRIVDAVIAAAHALAVGGSTSPLERDHSLGLRSFA